MPGRTSDTEVVEVQACDVRPVRHAVLRPGQPAERLVYPGDDDPDSVHLGVRESDAGRLVSVASFYIEALPTGVEHSMCGVLAGSLGARIRGMATLEEHRGRGFGQRLVERGVETLHQQGVRYDAVWCNARTSAAGYYERLGFATGSELFELPDIGEHVVMVRAVC